MNKLAKQLTRTAAIKAEMTRLLRQLEEQVTKKPVAKPGSWRHHPADWNKQNPSQSI